VTVTHLPGQRTGAVDLGGPARPSAQGVLVATVTHTQGAAAGGGAAGGLEHQGQPLHPQQGPGLLLGLPAGSSCAVRFPGDLLGEVAIDARRPRRPGREGPAGGQRVAGQQGVPGGRGRAGETFRIGVLLSDRQLLPFLVLLLPIAVVLRLGELVWRQVVVDLVSQDAAQVVYVNAEADRCLVNRTL